MTGRSVCYSPKCGHSEEGNVRDCPRCGKRMRSSTTIRVLGGVMFACGLFITAIIAIIFYYMSFMLAHPGVQTPGGSRFTGTADQASWISQFFWLLIAFGVAAMAAGLWQLITARRDRIVTIGVLVLAGLLFLVGREARWVLG
jgi:uncharacterized paraquat-inducible protein A